MLNKKGISLIELIVGMSIGLIGLFAVVSLFRFGSDGFMHSMKKAESKEYLSTLAHRFSTIFTYSQNLVGVSVPPLTTNIALGAPGQVLLGSWTSLTTTTPGTWITVANFRRELGFFANTAGNRRSQFKQTGIFYFTPTPTTSGVLFINYGNSTPMVPSYSDVYIPKVTEFKIDSPTYANSYLTNFRVQITIRDFSSGGPQDWRWCPVDDIGVVANCSTAANFKDLKQDFYITVANTVLAVPDVVNNSLTTSERILGPVYMFPIKE